MSLLYYESIFSELNLTRFRNEPTLGHPSGSLAVTDLIEDGTLTENRIEYSEVLSKAFARRFKELKSAGDTARPIYPYFHLRKDKFWHHNLKPGRSEAYSRLSTVTKRSQVDDNIAFASLDPELFELLRNPDVRQRLRASLQLNLTITEEQRRARLEVRGWDWLECEECVKDYFEMLGKELRNEPYNKTAHLRALMAKLRDRSETSVRLKHRYISGILVELGYTYISGYKPRFNSQPHLRDVVIAHIARQSSESERFDNIHETDPSPYSGDWNGVLDQSVPERIPIVASPKREYVARHINYSVREAENRKLGESGERFVMDFERFSLTRAGRADLANEVEWTSREKGDGLGYDVRSFRIGDDSLARDQEIFIEVKTTNRGKYQPFYITENEVQFSHQSQDRYGLYRVYDFSSESPRLYRIHGHVEDHLRLNPVLYRADFGHSQEVLGQ